jgi:hypothetical protein
MTQKLVFSPPETARRLWEIFDKTTGNTAEISPRKPSPGDTVLIEHNRVLKIGTHTEDGVRLRRNGRKVKKYVRVGVVK